MQEKSLERPTKLKIDQDKRSTKWVIEKALLDRMFDRGRTGQEGS